MTLTTLRTLLRMIEEKTRLVQLLDDYMGTDGLTVVIGTEHHGSGPAAASASWRRPTPTAHGTGAVGVIGPTRMRYSRAINAVDTPVARHQSHGRGMTCQPSRLQTAD